MGQPTALSQSIIEFLRSATSTKNEIATCRCGAIMKYRKTTFFYASQSWEVELPVCDRCNPHSGRRHDA